MNSMIEFILSRHSVRDFTGEAVDEKDLETIVRAGMSAPSAVNVQPWSFIVVTDKDILSHLCRRLPYAKMLEKAGAAIIVCGLPEKDDQFARKYWVQDCSVAAENILLAAHALHYGAVWTAVYPEADRINCVMEECKLPKNVIPLNVIPIGVPKNMNAAPMNKFKKENIHFNAW